MTRLDYLINQFMTAKGIKNPDYSSNEFIVDFISYLQEMQLRGTDYTKFLLSLGFDFTEEDTAEVGKGKDDTVVIPFRTNIITTDSKFRFLTTDDRRIIPGEFKVYESLPYVVSDFDLVELPFYIRNFMTQNPYTNKSINGFADLHNSENGNIIVGVYGSVNDKDKRQKVKMIENLKYQLDDHIIEECETDGDSYFYVIGSAKEKVRVNTRKMSFKPAIEKPLIAYGFEYDPKKRSR